MRQLICKRCAYAWMPRKNQPPVVCPKCKRADWDITRKPKETR